MFSIPSPLHPAIVHFPIALILVGTLIAVISIVLRRWNLPCFAAGLLALGAIGAVAATWSGEEDEEILGSISDRAEHLLDEHEEWGESTRNLALLAALLAVSAIVTTRFGRVSKILSIVTALVALGASYAVIETGHYGGKLVYEQGVGIDADAGLELKGASKRSQGKSHDDDDD